ncbi:unnamed protein product [Ectocarpus sp. 12 AP-2014]
MSGSASTAMDDHLQRFGTGNENGNDSDDSSSAGQREESSSHQSAGAVAGLAETSFWSTVFADTSRPVPNTVLGRWWHEQQPIVTRFVHDYGAVLVRFLTPFTPRAARRAGYCCGCRALLRSLDRIDLELPGGEGGWSSRWRSRRCDCGDRRTALTEGISSVCAAVGGAGVAAVIIMVAAAVSWCSWRRSSPSWLLLLGEVAIGSAGVAHYLARDDGHAEAKVLEAHLVALERSLSPFFHGVHACMRMVKCSQTLSFGLQLSVPMPPVARMEGRLPATGSGGLPGRAEVALRDLRSVVMDVLEGGMEQVNVLQLKERCGDTDSFLESGGQASDSGGRQSMQSLADLAGTERRLVVDLRRFLAIVAARVEGVMVEPETWGFWWDSQLVDVSEALAEVARYFEAASGKLETAIGCGGLPFSPSGSTSASGEMTAAAEAISSLRLHYEEIVVRLYSCQSNASSLLRGPSKSAADAWEALRQGLAEARLSTGPLNCDQNLWQKAEDLVETMAKEVDETGAALESGKSPSSVNNNPDPSRHLEAGTGWVSLASPKEEGPRVFEGGGGDHPNKDDASSTPDTGITDVHVGVPSPVRSRYERQEGAASRPTPEETVGEDSRELLVSELDSVLRARPLPPTCEKRLPLVSQQSIDSEDGSDTPEEQSTERPLGVATPPTGSALPIGSQNLMSELRAQLSGAMNEEFFSSDRLPCPVTSEAEEGSVVEGDRPKQREEDP